MSLVNGLKTFYIDIAKKQTIFQTKMADFNDKKPKNYKD